MTKLSHSSRKSRSLQLGRWLAFGGLRGLSSSVVMGLLVALYGLGTHYVASMRESAPLRVAGWFDVKSQVGNVIYAAAVNGAQLPSHLMAGEFAAAVQNMTNLAGIRSSIYTQLIHADATNSAEWFVRVVPSWILVLVILRAFTWLYRHGSALGALGKSSRERVAGLFLSRHRRAVARAKRVQQEALQREERLGWVAVDQGLIYVARTGLAAAVLASVLLNAATYYQDVSGVTGLFAIMGTGLATTLDLIAATGAAVGKELIWHLSFLVTDGKEKTLGFLLHDRNIEYVSHYLAKFPASKITAALHTAVYQALGAGILWAIAHALQRRRVQQQERRFQALPPHMKRYLAKRHPVGRRPKRKSRRLRVARA
jgi:hypothetical protein